MNVITIQDFLFERPSRRTPRVAQVTQDILGGFSFTSSRFTRNNNGLGLLQDFHVSKGFVNCGAPG
jgi:hypothetical protein